MERKIQIDITVGEIGINPYDKQTPSATGKINGVRWSASVQSEDFGWVIYLEDCDNTVRKILCENLITYLNSNHKI